MGKVKHRKQKPSMPYWWWIDADGCWFCKNRNGCNNCKAAKKDIKEKRRKNKNKIKQSYFLELPCEIGTRVFRVLYINTPDDEYYMSFSKEWVIRQGNFNLNDLPSFERTVFLTEKDAQLALQELKIDTPHS